MLCEDDSSWCFFIFLVSALVVANGLGDAAGNGDSLLGEPHSNTRTACGGDEGDPADDVGRAFGLGNALSSGKG